MTLPATSWRPAPPQLRTPRADPVGALLCVFAGILGLLQLVLSWSSVVFSVDLPASTALTGWRVFQTAGSAASLSATWAIGAYSVLAVGLAGGALVLLGLAALAPIDHRPIGAAILVLSIVSFTGAGFWLVRADRLTAHSLSQLFTHAGPGWYLFLVSGLLGVVGGIVVLQNAPRRQHVRS